MSDSTTYSTGEDTAHDHTGHDHTGVPAPEVHGGDVSHEFSIVDPIYASVDGQAGALLGKAIWTAQQAALYLNRSGAGFGTGPNHQMPSSGDINVFKFGFHTGPESLAANGYSYVNPDGSVGYFAEYYAFQAFTSVQMDAARKSLQLWDDLMQPSIVESDIDSADVAFANYTDQPGTQAYAYVMQARISSNPFYNVQLQDLGGDIWVAATTASNFQLDDGLYGLNTLVHEIGHAFGLLHPGNYNAAPGLALNYSVNAEYFQDARNYSLLSYWNPRDIGARDFDWSLSNIAFGSTPMVHDILAVQTMYGADMTTRTGDTVYGFNSNAGRDAFDFTKTPWPGATIWDAGGNDTIDASGFAVNQVIDLNPGALSSIGGITLDQAPSFEQVNANRAAVGLSPIARSTYDSNMAAFTANPLVGRLTDNVGIAYGAIVENAVGGSGADTLIGNAVDNLLSGNGGDDVLDGGLGNDLLEGGAGSDTASYSSALTGVVVDLRLAGSAQATGNGSDILVGIENLAGSAFNDTLIGDSGDNVLSGGRGDDVLDGGIGSDTVSYAGASAGVAVSLAGSGPKVTSEGSDTLVSIENLTGSAFADTLSGDDQDNRLSGLAGNDVLDGGLGHDVLDGGSGDDILITGGGDDSFVGGTGIDTVSYAAAGGAVAASLLAGTSSGQGSDSFSGVENLVGSAFGDSLTGDAGDNVIDGGKGDDLLDGGAGRDTASYAAATGGVIVSLAVTGAQATGEGNDTLTGFENVIGSAFNDTLTGDGGDNVLTGGAGNDVLDGGAGSDTASYATASGAVTVNLATGTSSGAHGADTLIGIENATGSALADTLTGNAGANVLDGGAGADSMAGGGGDDRYIVDNAADLVTEAAGAGTDTVVAFIGHTLASNVENLELGGAAALNGTGNALANRLTGNAAANQLLGQAGNDVIDGGAGDDLISGGAGNDTIQGGLGLDTLTYQLAAAGVVASLATGTASGGEDNDTFSGFENLDGTNFNDVLTGDSSSNTLTGRTGDDVMEGGLGDDVLSGGGGLDTASYANAASGVTVSLAITAAQDTGVGLDTLASMENLLGSAFADTLTGDALDNVINGGAGDDMLDGGAGRDTASYAGAAAGVTVSLGLQGTAQSTGNGNDRLIGFESLIGSSFADTLTGDDGDNVIDGGLGNDTLQGGGGRDTLSFASSAGAVAASLVVGTATGQGSDSFAGFENLTGSSGNDNLTGDAGANVIDGGAGSDVMAGGAGDDRYVVDVAGDTVVEATGGGTDTVAAAFTYVLGAEVENLELGGAAAIDGTGNAAANSIIGNGSANVLRGFGGDDTLDGAAGNDTLDGGLGDDVLIGGTGTDTATYEAATGGVTVNLSVTTAQATGMGSDRLSGIENLTGSAFADQLTGDALANLLTGGAGNDTLDGGAGNDTLVGGAGDDAFVGGSGIDTVSYGGLAAASPVVVNLAAGTAIGEGADTLSGIENVTGGAGADTITGDAGNNSLSGGGGIDTLVGAAGDDTLDGGLGNDVLTGGTGNDRYVVDAAGDVVNELDGEGIDTVASAVTYTLAATLENLDLTGTAAINGTGNAAANSLRGNSGNNTLDGGLGNDVIDGGLGTDVLAGGAGFDTVSFQQYVAPAGANSTIGITVDLKLQGTAQATGAGTKTLTGFENITGSQYHDRLYGDDADNIIDGAVGADVMAGRKGHDTYWVDSVGDGVVELQDEGIDTVGALVSYTLTANVENLTLFGAALNGTGNGLGNAIVGNEQANKLFGLDGDDNLDGRAGDDLLDGGTGVDAMAGGTGNDRYIVDHADDIVTEFEGEGTDMVESSVSHTLRANVENLVLTGAAAAGIGNGLDNVITGNASANSLSGGAGNDTLSGGAGDDVLDGGTGADAMTGGTGDDSYVVDEAGDSVIELAGEGTDTVSSGISYTLGTHVENLILTGSAVSGTGNGLANSITGNTFANVLDGGTGADTMAGGLGGDLYFVDDSGDLVVELAGEGADTVSSSVSHTLAANVEDLLLTGGAVDGIGNARDNRITGNAVANVLDGGDGNDRLTGGDGVDRMTGGAGGDTFVGEINATKVVGKNGPVSLDLILDFSSGSDKIDLSGIDANSLVAGDQAFRFVGNAAGRNAGDLSVRHFGSVNAAEAVLGFDIDGVDGASPYSGPVSVVFGNIDGGDPDFALVLFGTPSILASDLVL